jgi:hypothetical protein
VIPDPPIFTDTMTAEKWPTLDDEPIEVEPYEEGWPRAKPIDVTREKAQLATAIMLIQLSTIDREQAAFDAVNAVNFGWSQTRAAA